MRTLNSIFKIFINIRGFSLIELSVATGIVMVSLVAAGNIVNLIYNSNSHLDSLSKQNLVKSNFIGQIITESNWKATYSDPTNMAANSMQCLYDHTDCSAMVGQSQSFHLLDSKLNVIYHPMSPSTGNLPNGFTATGSSCTSFGAAATDACPYHYDLTWTPICNVGTCIDPLVKIHGQFHVNFASQVAGRPNSKDYLPMNFDVILNMKPRANLYAYPVTFYVNWNTNPGYTPFTFLLPHSPIANAEGAITLTKVTKGNPASLVPVPVGNTVSYTPPLNFYGMDFIDYEFKDEIGNKGKGRVWMKVVTPFTWVGDGGDHLTSNSLNWCGTATPAGLCSHNATPNSNSHFVFNNVCNFCGDVIIDAQTSGTVAGFEVSARYKGGFTQNATLNITTGVCCAGGPNDGYAHQGFYLGNGSYNTSGFDLNVRMNFRRNPVADPTFVVDSLASFTTTNTLVLYASGLNVVPGAQFTNNGTLVVSHDWSQPSYIKAPNYDLGNVSFKNGWATPYVLASPITVHNFYIDGVNTSATSMCGDAGNDLSVLGTIKAVNGGGVASCGWNGVNYNQKIIMRGLGPVHQQLIGSLPGDGNTHGSLTNLVSNALTPVDIIGDVGVNGVTVIAGPINAGTSNFYLDSDNWGAGSTLSVAPGAPMPHFNNLIYDGGARVTLNNSITVDKDLTFDRPNYSVYALNTADKLNAQIILMGDFHLQRGQMDQGPSNVVVVNFQGTTDQSLISERQNPTTWWASGATAAPSIWVNKASGKFSIVELPAAECIAAGHPFCAIYFLGDLVVNSATSLSITSAPSAQYYFGYYWTFNTVSVKSIFGFDFGSADIEFHAGTPWYFGAFDFNNGTLSAHNINDVKGTLKNGTFNVSGDFATGVYSTYANTNSTYNFVGAAITHNLSFSSLLNANFNIADTNIVVLGTDVVNTGAISINGPAALLKQNGYQINSTMNGNGLWNSGAGSTPQNYTGNRSGFTGTIY